jgi:hypothetical protein
VKTIEVWDDKAYADGEKVPATRREVVLQFGDLRGEMDLSDGNYRALWEVLKPWFDVCHDPDPEAPKVAPRVTAGGKLRRGPDFPAGSTAARDWRRGLRGWSDGLGLVNRTDPDYPAWQTVTGKHYYPAELEDGYALHLDGREEEALAKVARFKPQEA